MSQRKKARERWDNLSAKLAVKREKYMEEERQIREEYPTVSYLDVLSKKRLLVYALILFVPPYGLYLVLKKDSDFRLSEKITWTMVVVLYMLKLLQLTIFPQLPLPV
ncbi:MAG: hypothetical protein HUJ57_01435 [Erysipelotrichaceae bacterium]|nr:hypothetical protein [Erysipelotrichaceae bacterium]